MKHITREFLVANGICQDQLKLFDEHFPNGRAPVTVELAASVADVFDFWWLAEKTLLGFALADWRALDTVEWQEYLDAVKKPQADYECEVAPVKAVFWNGGSLDKYDSAMDIAHNRYAAKKRPLIDKYLTEIATAWAELYLSQSDAEPSPL